MGYKRSQLATGAFLGVLRTSNVMLLLTMTGLNYGPIIAAASTVEVAQTDVNSDIDHVTDDDENFIEPDASSVDAVGDTSSTNVENEQLADSVYQEHESILPASLAKAVLVGAQRRSQEITDSQKAEDGETGDSDIISTPDTSSEMGASRNSKPPLTGCVWGSAGCNKKWNVQNSGTSINSSSVDETNDDVDAPTTSVFSGSATAKIKAHVQEARGGTSSGHKTPLSSMRNTRKNSGIKSNRIASEGEAAAEDQHKSEDNNPTPPQGFELSARVVTSPSDGLSYFLDVPADPNALELENWMMNIPYTYVECGPTVESTTESFLLEDMVVRHFPHAAAMGHWVNLAGGVTIERSKKDHDENELESYINESIDGHPKLLVALSPIEITVSGNNEETRTFYPGEVVLMEDTLGKGHKMRAARGKFDDNSSKSHGQDLKVLMVSLPHSVHYTVSDLNNYARHQRAKSTSSTNTLKPNEPSEHPSPSSYSGAKHSIFGLVPKHLSKGRMRRDYRSASMIAHDTKPCPLEYDSAYSSLFTPPYHQRRSNRRRQMNHPKVESVFSSEYPPPPGHSTYDEESILFRFLPSLRRTMLFGIGLSLTSSFVYCVQLLYPPLLALIGGATFVMGGALINVLGTRWSYRQWLAVWEEEWRWRREMKRHKEAARVKIETQDTNFDADETIVDDLNDAHTTEDELIDTSIMEE
jgi:hypothetical protein